MANISKKNQEQLITTALYIGGGLLVLHYGGDAIKRFLENLNPLSDPASTHTVDDAASTVKSPFSPAFWKAAPAGSLILTDTNVANYINILLQSVNHIFSYSNNFSQAFSVFKALKTQSQVSYLADKFLQSQQEDLLSWLRKQTLFTHNFSDAEVTQIINYVSGLPKYKL